MRKEASGFGHPFSNQNRRRFGRTRTGCLTCRQRRKKCDENKPTCFACIRNKLPCRWAQKKVAVDPTSESSSWPDESACTDLQQDVCTTSGLSQVVTSDKLKVHQALLNHDNIQENEVLRDAANDMDIQWNQSLRSFVFSNKSRASSLLPSSPILLQHYLTETISITTPKPAHSNPFLTYLLPLAVSDDLLMNSVLAMSGAHLCFKNKSSLDIYKTTWRHYSLVLSNLRNENFSSLVLEDSEKCLRLLLVLLILCHVEAISGDDKGSIFPHLRASRQLILNLSNRSKSPAMSRLGNVISFAVEAYSYLALVANIAPTDETQERTINFDPFLSTLGVEKSLETSSSFFSCGPDLFERIPAISQLAAESFATGRPIEKHDVRYATLLSEIEEWQSPPALPDMQTWASEHYSAGETYRQALLIYLKAGCSGPTVNNPKIICEIQEHIDLGLPLLYGLSHSPFGAIQMWPYMIFGSCLITDSQRRELFNSIESSRYFIAQVAQAKKLLEILWSDKDELAYGPHGLSYVMKKHGINLSMA